MTNSEYKLLKKISKSSGITVGKLYPIRFPLRKVNYLVVDQQIIYLRELGLISCDDIRSGYSTVSQSSVISITTAGVHALTEHKETLNVLRWSRGISFAAFLISFATLGWNVYVYIVQNNILP